MAWPKSTTAQEKYDLYQQGYSLAQVAEVYGCTRNSIFGLFKTRGWPTRPKRKPKAYVEFNGAKYTLRNHGYYAKTNGDRALMHRDVWEHHNGEIPAGWDVHHKDENKENNDIGNLECLPKAEHTRLYSPHNNQYTRGRKKEKCGA
jgi:hypothetical protein